MFLFERQLLLLSCLCSLCHVAWEPWMKRLLPLAALSHLPRPRHPLAAEESFRDCIESPWPALPCSVASHHGFAPYGHGTKISRIIWTSCRSHEKRLVSWIKSVCIFHLCYSMTSDVLQRIWGYPDTLLPNSQLGHQHQDDQNLLSNHQATTSHESLFIEFSCLLVFNRPPYAFQWIDRQPSTISTWRAL